MKAVGAACVAVLVLLPAVALTWGNRMGLELDIGRPVHFGRSPAIAATSNMAATPPTPAEVSAASTDTLPTPVPAPTTPTDTSPTPDAASSTSEGWSKAPALAEAVAGAMDGFSGHYSVVVQELDSGQRWELNAERRYHPASTIKMPVALYALEKYRRGELGWQDLITYTPADFESPGGGTFEGAPFGGQYPVENLINRALIYSNNVAVNMLGRHLGWDNIREWSKSINGELYIGEDGGQEVTALSELGWWLHLNQVASEDPERAELLLSPLRQVAYHGRIGAGLPKQVAYLHKFGSYDGNFHDGGIIYAEKPYVLIVLTGGGGEGEADDAIARVSAAVYSVMTTTDGLKHLP